jgi:spore maturation protein CgeB
MKKTISAALLWVALAAPAFAGCEKPSAPSAIPDGKSAAMDDMMAAKKAVDAFKKDMEEYLACEKSSTRVESAQVELEKVASRFNAEVRAFKAKG